MTARASIFDEPGRYREARATAPKTSGRIGPTGRTMHARVTSITRANGGARRAGGSLDYDARVGRHRSRADELETEGGTDRKDMAKALQASEDATGRKNGVVARRIIAELPAEMDADARRAVAERVAAWFADQGHPTHWAVHSHNGQGEFQPHLHMTVVARRCRLEGGAWKAAPAGRSGVKGGGGEKPILAGPAALQHWRREVMAAAINTVAVERGIRLAAAWHGGRLTETGIDRPAKRRRPEVALRAPDRAWADDRGLGAVNEAVDAGDEIAVRTARKAHVEQQRQLAADRAAAAAAERGEREGMAIATGKGRVSAVVTRLFVDAASHWRDHAQQLQAVIEAERAKPTMKPASEKQRRIAAELAERVGVMLPDGWDVSAGSAGAAVRLLTRLKTAKIHVSDARKAATNARRQTLKLTRQFAEIALDRMTLAKEWDEARSAAKAAQEAAEHDQAARQAAEAERDQARLERDAARTRPTALETLRVIPADVRAVATMRQRIASMGNDALKHQEVAQVETIKLLHADGPLDLTRRTAETEIRTALGLIRAEMQARAFRFPTAGQQIEAAWKAAKQVGKQSYLGQEKD